jgi:CHAT domain-containing protein
MAIAAIPGLYQTIRLRPAAAIGSESAVLIVSVPVAAEGGLAALSDAEDEAQAVSKSFSSARWLRGSDATVSAVRNELRGKAVFHFAGHAFVSPERSGLALAEVDPVNRRPRIFSADSFVDKELRDLQLAVLSACPTDADTRLENSGTGNLTHALLRAGVPHVIASRWNVDSTETATFMKHFYARLLGGGNISDSMRTAELALASQPASAHPYYWSAFKLEGQR